MSVNVSVIIAVVGVISILFIICMLLQFSLVLRRCATEYSLYELSFKFTMHSTDRRSLE